MTAPQEAVAVPAPRNRLPLLVGAGLGLGLLLFLLTKILGGGGDTVEAISGSSVQAVPATTTTAVPAAPGEAAPVETFEVFNTKNPFLALRTKAVASTASAPATPASTPAAPRAVAAAPVAVQPALPAATAAAAPAAAPVPTGATGGQATAPVRTTRVALLDVFAEGDRIVANVRVNDTVAKVAAGDTFAGNFKVVSLDSAERCGRFLFGDDQFRLCRGEEVLK